MAENETVEFALCFKCKKHGNFVLQPDGMWQCPNCHSLREIATTKKEGDLTNSTDSTTNYDSTMNKVSFVPAHFTSPNGSQVDGLHFTKSLREEIKWPNNNGYEIVSLTPITSGNFQIGVGYAYGYSYTEGIIVVARKI